MEMASASIIFMKIKMKKEEKIRHRVPDFLYLFCVEIITTEFSLLMSYMQFCLIIGFGKQPVKMRP